MRRKVVDRALGREADAAPRRVLSGSNHSRAARRCSYLHRTICEPLGAAFFPFRTTREPLDAAFFPVRTTREPLDVDRISTEPSASRSAPRYDLRTGIRVHDVFFFDDTDLSYEAEDAVIRRCLDACADLDIEVEPRNQARVHLWYPEKFGRAIPPLRSLEHAIRSFPVTCCSVGASLSRDGELTVHSTHGYRELFSMTLSPSRTTNAPREVYDAKTARWLAVWPRLTKTPVADQRAG